LLGVGQKHDAARLRIILQQPTEAMADGGMQPADVTEEDLTALIAFLESLK
jgi:cytochrome c2